MQLTKIKNVESYQKDEISGAVLSIDDKALIAYKRKKKNNEVVFSEINSMKKQHSQISNDINNMKQELVEMKKLISQFLSLQKR